MAKKDKLIPCSATMDVHLCGSCMQELKPNWSYCPFCGTEIDWEFIKPKAKKGKKNG